VPHFAFGLISVICAVGSPAAYLIVRQLRRGAAWIHRDEPPKERAGAFVVISALMGLVAGCLLQPAWDAGAACRADGGPVVGCSLRVMGPFHSQRP